MVTDFHLAILATMKLGLPNSPAKLVAVALFGALVTGGTFLLISPLIRFCHGHGLSEIISVLAVMCLFGGGFYLALNAESELTNGIAAERWTASQLAPIRKVFGSRYIMAASLALIAVGFILFLTNLRRSDRLWPFLLLSMSLSRIFAALKEPRPRPDSRTYTPIQSDNWGRH